MNIIKSKKGAMETKTIITLLLGILLIVGAILPVSISVITNLTTGTGVNNTGAPLVGGTTAIIVGLIPLFLGIMALVKVAGAMKSGN